MRNRKKNWIIGSVCFVLFAVKISTSFSQSIEEVDVCVYGGTSAGVIAAYTARSLGKTVLLIEPGRHLGGLSSAGLGYTDIGNKYAVTGLARDFYRRIGTHYGKFEQWIFEPHVAEKIFNEYINSAKVNVWYDHRITSASNVSGVIQQIELENSINPSTASKRMVRAKIFIDCSYEGDLMAKAGVSYTVGRESNEQYKEKYNGFQLRDKHQFADGIDPYKIKGQPESGLLWGISPGTASGTGAGDKKVQAYNFRICLSRDPQNKITITRPPDYDSTRYELLLRVLEKEPKKPFNLILKPDIMPNNKTDINNNGPFSTDMIGVNYEYPDADYTKRAVIIKDLENYNKGLLYFIGNDSRMPQHLREEMLKWGYPKDEYDDNGNWSHQAYIREARRMIGEYVMTQHNCEGDETVTDGVGMAAYTMDSHNIQRIVVNGMVKNEGDVQVGGFPPYPISYRSIIPKEVDCKNLYAPVCLSATHIAYGSIRMEPVFMVLAQSAATAAVQAIDKSISVQQVDVQLIQKALKENPLADGTTKEILIDNDDKGSITLVGSWTTIKNAPGCYGPSLLSSSFGEKSKIRSVKFSTLIEKDGAYEVYVYIPRAAGASSTIEVVFYNGKRKHTQDLKPNQLKIEGQTSGEWMLLGQYDLEKDERPYVEVSTRGADGAVVADAVLISPVR
ncbi:MAG TPA: FAD-dependent oxidoreductase [Chryseolinea sp.]|nr:FAD-dependent oxidoreductase [Chryseolinea sp.]